MQVTYWSNSGVTSHVKLYSHRYQDNIYIFATRIITWWYVRRNVYCTRTSYWWIGCVYGTSALMKCHHRWVKPMKDPIEMSKATGAMSWLINIHILLFGPLCVSHVAALNSTMALECINQSPGCGAAGAFFGDQQATRLKFFNFVVHEQRKFDIRVRKFTPLKLSIFQLCSNLEQNQIFRKSLSKTSHSYYESLRF